MEIDQVKEKLSKFFKITQNKNRIFINDKYLIEISVLGKDSIIVCDAIIDGKMYSAYMISIKRKGDKIPNRIVKKLLTYLNLLDCPSDSHTFL